MESFRDRLTTVSKEGNRLWVYAKAPKGKFTTYRNLVAYVCLVALFSAPFIKVGGYPLLLLNIFERKFVIVGSIFWPQDFYILAFVLLTFFVFIILFTAIFGRIWCGWACPQTIFMEMVFRKIEYWIEGDAKQQRQLNQAPWTTDKILKKGSKHFLFALFSLIIGHLVMCYLIGYESVWQNISQGSAIHSAAFWGVLAFSAMFMFVFSYLREQACTIICPYGRLQGVLVSKSTVVVAYDTPRGEPRGKKGHTSGDCVDCSLCVQVCPTGIDIRNGTQLECINCTACIDACDEVMHKLNRPQGLIRFDSLQGILSGAPWRATPRIYLYGVFLGTLMVLLGTFIYTRKNIQATLLRVPGQTYQSTPAGSITNLYNLQIINKSFTYLPIEMRLTGLAHAKLHLVGNTQLTLAPESLSESVFIVEVPESEVPKRNNTLYLELYSGGKLIEKEKVSFLGPIK
ncbi:MAG TPA: cytochrome c oxidase accessory protein CcoG [Cytophagales bacterium]|nr:cytochrome c oxidase accessory protein CcoG [Cytophagales bacterium]